jgi:hypothetical protein
MQLRNSEIKYCRHEKALLLKEVTVKSHHQLCDQSVLKSAPY